MINALRRFLEELRRRVDKSPRGFSPAQFDREIQSVQDSAREEFKRSIEFSLQVLGDKKQVSKFVAPVLKGFDRMSGSTAVSFSRIIKQGIEKDLPSPEIRDRVQNALGVVQWKARTLSETAVGGVTRAKKLSDDLADGVTRWRYTGPSPDREFCRENIGKEFTIEEIRKLDNRQGLPVEFFCGGYNCRHRWVAIVDPKSSAPPETLPPAIVTPPKQEAPAPVGVSPELEGDFFEPSGETKVSGAMVIQGGNKQDRATAQEVLDIIDSIHGDGALNKIPIKLTAAKSKSNYGYFRSSMNFYGGGLKGVDILVRTWNPEQRLTTIHEIGHFIDAVGLPGPSWTSEKIGGALDNWRKAVTESKEIQRLGELRKTAQKWQRHHIDYLTSSKEAFARSYAQYVAMRSNNSKLREDLDRWRKNDDEVQRLRQWSDESFAPIAKALDEVFESMGWIKRKKGG